MKHTMKMHKECNLHTRVGFSTRARPLPSLPPTVSPHRELCLSPRKLQKHRPRRTSVRVEGKATSCKWNWGTHWKVTVSTTPRQPRCRRAAWKMSALMDSEHSRISPEAVSSVSATTCREGSKASASVQGVPGPCQEPSSTPKLWAGG